jgi:anti-sigma factor RsiW
MMGRKLTKRRRPQSCDFLREETLEAYLLGRLPGQQQGSADDPEVRMVEEHLLWCEDCQKKAESEGQQIEALRAALAAYAPTESRPAKGMAMAARSLPSRSS